MAIISMAFFLYFSPSVYSQEEKVNKHNKQINALMERYNQEIQKMKDAGVFEGGQLKEQLKAGLSRRPMVGKLIERFPKIIDFMTEMFEDKNAIPNLLTLSSDKKRLWNFIYIQIFIFIFSFLWRLTYRKKSFFSFDYLFNAMARLVVVMFLRVYSIYYFFGDEVRPTYEVFKRVFFS